MLHHEDHGGDGEPVVLLHAFPLDSGMWHRLVPLVRERWRVVTVDLPGLGASEVPDAEPSMAGVASAVLDVLDALTIDRAHVFGISTGGYVALQMATDAPSRLSGLVLGSTTTLLVEPDDPAQRRRTAAEVERLGTTSPVAGSADEGVGATAHREQPELVTMLRETIDRANPAGVAWMARAIASRSDTTDALIRFSGPVALVFGAEDQATPASRGEEMLAARGGRGHLEVLPGVGHLTALEAPTSVAAHLLARVGRP